jgi:hypothetical protein
VNVVGADRTDLASSMPELVHSDSANTVHFHLQTHFLGAFFQ